MLCVGQTIPGDTDQRITVEDGRSACSGVPLSTRFISVRAHESPLRRQRPIAITLGRDLDETLCPEVIRPSPKGECFGDPQDGPVVPPGPCPRAVQIFFDADPSCRRR